jgi:spore coat-associated protein N
MKSKTKKILLSFAILGAAASIAGLGTFASFTSSTSATHTLASGTVSITLGTVGAANRLTIGASNLVPGDTVQRAADLINNGSGSSDNLASITLTSTASPSSALDTDVTNGLQLVIDKCSVAWTEAGNGTTTPYTYTCSGSTTSVLATRAVIGTNVALANLSSLTTGSTDHLRVTETFPAGAGNTLQGLTSTLTYTFTGNQRTASNK